MIDVETILIYGNAEPILYIYIAFVLLLDNQVKQVKSSHLGIEKSAFVCDRGSSYKKVVDVCIRIKILMNTDATKSTDAVLIFHTEFTEWNWFWISFTDSAFVSFWGCAPLSRLLPIFYLSRKLGQRQCRFLA